MTRDRDLDRDRDDSHRGHISISGATYDRLVGRGWSHDEICKLVEGLVGESLDRTPAAISEHGPELTVENMEDAGKPRRG